jgi:hypothetical protein
MMKVTGDVYCWCLVFSNSQIVYFFFKILVHLRIFPNVDIHKNHPKELLKTQILRPEHLYVSKCYKLTDVAMKNVHPHTYTGF